MKFLKILPSLFFIVAALLSVNVKAQYKDFSLTQDGDTVNIIDKKGLKQGNWFIRVEELRGEPGYEEEGVFKNGKKEGTWRRYTLGGDLLAIENYKFGGKDGVQQYFTFIGDLIREESWKGYNPDAPYDTIPVYGSGNNEITSFKIVKAEQYSVKHGDWKYYEPETGRQVRSETYDRNFLKVPYEPAETETAKETKPKEKIKPKEVLEFEKKNSGKKKVKVIDGKTGL
ncbi:MAG: hypothetical protein IPJ81_08230 [Chitinophagaceae bacterium]|nr:hypothetical protein [Chitinophagaceae bacterium]